MKKFHNIILLILLSIHCIGTYAAEKMEKKMDSYYMQIAIQHAKKNLQAPFAALIVDNKTGKIVAQGLNDSKKNPTFHGEMVAINNAAAKYPHLDWSNVTLYTTAEPCSMCQSAIVWAGIPKVVFGTSLAFLKSHQWNQIDIPTAEINSKSYFYKGTVKGGVLADKANKLFVR